MTAVPLILAQLAAVGAWLEYRGDRLIVCAGRRPVPMALIAEARAAKAALSKVLDHGEAVRTGDDEHLQRRGGTIGAEMLPPAEDAQMSAVDEHLRARSSTSAEDAHLAETMSTFDGSRGFPGFPNELWPKMLTPSSSNTFDTSNRDGAIRHARAEGFTRLDPDRLPEIPAHSPVCRDDCQTVGETLGPETIAATATLPAPDAPVETSETWLGEPVQLRDGRRLWRFHANDMPLSATPQAMDLIDEARHCGTVLVADGSELIVVERWLSRLPSETRDALRRRAAEVIGAMRQQRRARRI
jgi:hypothetical protein